MSILGCKKEMTSTEIPTSVESKNVIVPYDFDWETADYMPAPAGTNILVPWASSANKSFPLIYGTDIKKADGWALVYNTFSPQSFTQPAYFILYNKYRGLLRGYFYLTPGSAIPSSNISHSLIQDVSGTPIPSLTYSSTEVMDLTLTKLVSSTVQQFKTSSTGTWYAAEFEMVYDPNIGSKNAASTKMTWEVSSVNTTNMTLNGVSQGTIKGTISQTVTSGSMLGQSIPGSLKLGDNTVIDSWDLPAVIKTGLKNGIEKGLQGIAENVLNAIFGGTSATSTQYADLTTSATYTLAGTATDVYQLQNPSLVIPGANGQDNVAGYTPLYKDPLGVFALTGAPKVDLYIPGYWGDEFTDIYWNMATCKLNINSYNIVFNPSIINSNSTGATIQNLQQKIVSFKNYYSMPIHYNYFPIHQDPETPIPSSAVTEDIRGVKAIIDNVVGPDYIVPFKRYLVATPINTGSAPEDTFNYNKPMPSTVLRISFDVVPNNGAPKVTVVKSFELIVNTMNFI
jgi:hypothetical protein